MYWALPSARHFGKLAFILSNHMLQRSFVFAVGFIGAALLTACEGAGPPGGFATDGLASQKATSGGDLLYISDAQYLYIYTYPAIVYVKELLIGNEISGLCSDARGDVFVTEFIGEAVLEYPHSGEGPTATLPFPDARPSGCSVDPTSHSLAVTNYSGKRAGETGSIGIFKQSTSPTVLHDSTLFYYDFCTYDAKGNLFVDGQDIYFNPVIAELPKGASRFTDLTLRGLPKSFGYPAGLVWDGKYLALGDLDSSVVYRLQVSGDSATVVSSVRLRKGQEVEQFTLVAYPGRRHGMTLIGPNSADRSVYFWSYPRGGKPAREITGLDGAFGSAISVAPER